MSFGVPAEREWLTAAEAAAEKLPELASSKSQVNRIITAAGIKTRSRCGRGGGREFHWTSLPREARDAYLKRHGKSIDTEDADARTRPAEIALKADARTLIVDAATAFIADSGKPKGEALETFCRLHNKKKTRLAPWVYEAEPKLALHQLRSWERAVRVHGAGALIDRRGRPKGTSKLARDRDLAVFVTAEIAARPHLSATGVLDAVRAKLRRELPLRTLQAFISDLRSQHAPMMKALNDPDRYRSHHKPAFGSRNAGSLRLNQLWEIDATRGDAMCLTHDGSRRRFTLTAVIDVRSRRAMVLVSSEPKAAATQALLRRAIVTWGFPETLKADNGKEFINRAVERFCRDAVITLKPCRPFSPEEKPHIERFFGTLNRDLFEKLPGYVGHNVAQRQAIEHRRSFAHRFGEEAQLVLETALSPEGLQARIDAWLNDVYERRPHDGDGMNGATPADVGLALAGDARALTNPRALDMLLFPAPDSSGIRVVVKSGVRVGNAFYVAPELGAHMGDRVFVRLDPHDASRIVVYSHDGSAFLCVAEDKTGIPPERLMRIAREAQALDRKRISSLRIDTKKVQRLFPGNLADRQLEDARGDGFSLATDSREAMIAAEAPRALIEHRRAADELARRDAPPKSIEPTQDEIDGAAEFFAERAAMNASQPEEIVQREGYTRPLLENDLDFWAWGQARKAAGLPVDHGDQQLLAELAASFDFQELVRIHAKRAKALGGASPS